MSRTPSRPGPIQQAISSIFSKKERLNQAAIMAGARVLGLGLGFVGSAWAARCLGPHNFGISGMVLGIMVQTSLVFGLLNDSVLVREYKNAPSPESGNHLVPVTILFRLGGALLLSAVAAVLLGSHRLPAAYHFAGWFFIPIMILTALQPLWVFQAAERQHFQSIIALLQPLLTAGLYLVFFRPGMPAGADLVVRTAVLAVMVATYWTFFFRWFQMKGRLFDRKYFGMVKTLIARSGWMCASALAINVYANLELPLVGWLYSLDELGKYRTAVSIMGAAQAIFDIVPTLLFPRLLEWKKLGEEVLWRRQIKLVWIFSGLGIAGTVLAFLVLPLIYPILFGPAFQGAAFPCAILIGSKFLVMVTTVLFMGLITDARYDKKAFLITFATAAFSLTSNLVFIPKFGMYAAALTNVASEVLVLSLCVAVGLNKMAASRAETERLNRVLTGGGDK